jgi:Excalibur calcium-binding domain
LDCAEKSATGIQLFLGPEPPAETVRTPEAYISPMRKLITIAVVGFLAWRGYEVYQSHRPAMGYGQAASESGGAGSARFSEAALNSQGVSFRCDGRIYCSQMTSCEEATYFLKNCPGVKMDGDHDGVPCERQWCD